MSHRNHVETLVKDLGDTIGLDKLALDEKGYCCLVFDGKIYVEIEFDERTDQLVFSSRLGKPKTEKLLDLYKHLLQANYFYWKEMDGVKLAITGLEGEITQICEKSAGELDFPTFQSILEKFVDRAEEWMTSLQQDAPLPDMTKKGDQETPTAPIPPSDETSKPPPPPLDRPPPGMTA